MIRRYWAPYILNRFQPHFTLLTEVPSKNLDQTTQELKEFFEQKVRELQADIESLAQVNIESLALMSRPKDSLRWQIAKEIKLR